MGDQQGLPDLGVSNYRSAPCPMCNHRVTWTIAQGHTTKIVCDNTIEQRRGKKNVCGFTMRRAEWDYLREKPHTAPKLRAMFGKEKEETERPMDPIVKKMLEADRVAGKETGTDSE